MKPRRVWGLSARLDMIEPYGVAAPRATPIYRRKLGGPAFGSAVGCHGERARGHPKRLGNPAPSD